MGRDRPSGPVSPSVARCPPVASPCVIGSLLGRFWLRARPGTAPRRNRAPCAPLCFSGPRAAPRGRGVCVRTAALWPGAVWSCRCCVPARTHAWHVAGVQRAFLGGGNELPVVRAALSWLRPQHLGSSVVCTLTRSRKGALKGSSPAFSSLRFSCANAPSKPASRRSTEGRSAGEACGAPLGRAGSGGPQRLQRPGFFRARLVPGGLPLLTTRAGTPARPGRGCRTGRGLPGGGTPGSGSVLGKD